MKRKEKSINGRVTAVGYPQKSKTIVLFGLCKPGMAIAVLAHWLLMIGALWMVAGERRLEYLWFLVGYSMVAWLLTIKTIKLCRSHRIKVAKSPKALKRKSDW